MTDIREKVAHVLRAKQTRDHHCHWPGCDEQVPPAKWGCRAHWKRLPKYLRDKIWDAYDPGQEIKGTPTRAYLEVAREVQAYIASLNAPLPAGFTPIAFPKEPR